MDSTLEELRKEIDAIDTAIIALFAARFRVTETVGMHKKKHDIVAVDKDREARHMQTLETFAVSQGLNPKLMKKIFRLTINEVVERHAQIKNGKSHTANKDYFYARRA